jgi:hypothetical protein
MNLLDKFSKELPTLGLISIVFSTFYNVGFLSAAATPDLITNLNYQDILNSSIYVLSALLPVYYTLRLIGNDDRIEISGFSLTQKFIYFSLLVGVTVFVFAKPSVQFGWLMLIFMVNPLTFWISTKFKFSIERTELKILSLVVAISIACYTYGFSSVGTVDCMKTQYLTTKDCNNCLILKIYSDFIILRKSDGIVAIVPNAHEYEIKTKLPDYDAMLKDRKCNVSIGFKEWLEGVRGGVANSPTPQQK